MKKGDTWPPMRGEASDETGSPVDLSVADSLEFIAVGTTHTISGAAAALQPPIADADGVHHWNWQYNFVAGDTDVPDTYACRLVVTWDADSSPPEVESFPNTGHETLTIEDVP